ncbi:hypothetical protein [Nonomuraea insulae]|uniref:Uncharacterized protein n=1 Tax=Nonomuraea insulae TaxID=1616787 RepID=A0ABW1D418_9ACTN
MSKIPSWSGPAALVWSCVYAVLGLAWALGAPAFPWGASDPDPDGQLSLLAGLAPESGGWWVAAFAVVSGLTAWALARREGTSRVPLWLAWPIVLFLVVLVPDSRLMMGVAYTPLLLFAPLLDGPFGQVGLGDAWPWPVLNQLGCVLGGLLLAGAALRYRRGGRDGGWTSAASAARWGRPAVAVAVATPLFYCATRWAWALGIPLGVSPEFLEAGARDTPGIWLAGAYLATVGALGGVLTLGLVQRWGEVFPRWMIGLRGRRVPILLAVIPAGFVAVIITVAGQTYIRRGLAGHFRMDEWGAWLPECFWPIWGAALAAAALAYYLRRRGARAGRQ